MKTIAEALRMLAQGLEDNEPEQDGPPWCKRIVEQLTQAVEALAAERDEARQLLTLEAIASGQARDPVRVALLALGAKPCDVADAEQECAWSPLPNASRARAVREALEKIASGRVDGARMHAVTTLTPGPRGWDEA